MSVVPYSKLQVPNEKTCRLCLRSVSMGMLELREFHVIYAEGLNVLFNLPPQR